MGQIITAVLITAAGGVLVICLNLPIWKKVIKVLRKDDKHGQDNSDN